MVEPRSKQSYRPRNGKECYDTQCGQETMLGTGKIGNKYMNILIPYFAYVSIKDELFHIFISYFPSA